MGSSPRVDIGYGFEVDPDEIHIIDDMPYVEQRQAEDAYEIVIVSHGALSYGDVNYAVFIKDAHRHGDWDCPVDISDIKNWPEREEQLKRAAERLGVKFTKAKFMALCSYG
jgi:hypothetical protein